MAVRWEEFWTVLSFWIRDVWEPNFSCIHEKEPDKGHVDHMYGFLLLTLVGTSKTLQDVDTGPSPGD